MRRAGDGFACAVATSPGWSQHVRDMSLFLDEFSGPIEKLAAMGASVTFDVALEPGDREAAGVVILVLLCSPSFMQLLASRGVALEVSLYP